MSANKTLSWSFVEESTLEADAIKAARARGEEVGCRAISPAVGATLRMLAAALRARTILEIGTGTGVSTMWLLSGMANDGVITTIDAEPEFQNEAREALYEAGIPTSRTRLISGRALDVLPRMADHGYDLALLDTDVLEYAAYMREMERIIRPGGIVAIAHALWGDTVGDPARREPETVAIREILRNFAEDDGWITNLLSVGDGLLIAVKR